MIKISQRKKNIIKLFDKIGRRIFIKATRQQTKRNVLKLEYTNIFKILFVEFWGIGDLIMASGALRALRSGFPRAEITLLSKKIAQDLFKNTNYIDKYIFYDFPWTRFTGKYNFLGWEWLGLIKLIKILREDGYDLTLDARGDFRNNIIMFLTGAKRRIGYNFTGGEYFLTDVVPSDDTKQHRVDEWANLVRYIGIDIKDMSPRLSISDEEDKWAEEFLIKKGIAKEDLVIGIHPGARIKKRCWPLERFARVSEYARDRYNAKVIIFIEPDGYGENIPIAGNFIKAKVPLRELISLITKMDLLICNDGGVMHIAAAVRIPVVAIFGPTEPRWFFPYGEGHKIVIKEGFSCRPCYEYCKYKEPYCVTGITIDDVVKAVDEKLDSIIMHV